MPGVPELTPTEFCARWSAVERGKSVVLLDVREHDELETAAVTEALHIPMREIPGRMCSLTCHSAVKFSSSPQSLLITPKLAGRSNVNL